MKLTFKKLREDAIIPHSQTKTSAGLDLHVCLDEPLTLGVGEIKTLHNSVGVIDSDYRGEIMVPIINHGAEPYTFQPGERFAQLVVTPVIFPEIEEADTLPESERGLNGFGSTGKL